MACHDIIDDIERDCWNGTASICVSIMTPIVTDDAELNHMRKLVQQRIQALDPRLSIHDFRMVRGASHTNLIFDMIIPYEMESRKAELKRQVDEAVRQSPTGISPSSPLTKLPSTIRIIQLGKRSKLPIRPPLGWKIH